MNVAEMKKEINQKMDNLNEAQLKVILKIIKKADDEEKESKFDAESFFKEVVSKYGNVLQKLAQ
ncbi:MAG TPA: hypothetical protein VIM07_03460 [Chitinophagaceae bacterium]